MMLQFVNFTWAPTHSIHLSLIFLQIQIDTRTLAKKRRLPKQSRIITTLAQAKMAAKFVDLHIDEMINCFVIASDYSALALCCNGGMQLSHSLRKREWNPAPSAGQAVSLKKLDRVNSGLPYRRRDPFQNYASWQQRPKLSAGDLKPTSRFLV